MGGGVVGVVGVGVVVGVVGVGVAKSVCFAFADPCDKRLVLPEQERFVNSVVTDIINGTFWLVVVLPSSYNKHNKKPLLISFSFLFRIK